MLWSFDRKRDSKLIEKKIYTWQGPFSWPGYEDANNLESLPDKQGVYIFTFPFNDGFLLYLAGITNSTKKRFQAHTREYKKGNYNVLDIDLVMKGVRSEQWHGWSYAKNHRQKFNENKDHIIGCINSQLAATHVFVCEIHEPRIRERMEAAIMLNIYLSKKYWSEVADRGMHLKVRENSEMPIHACNQQEFIIYGLPCNVEI